MIVTAAVDFVWSDFETWIVITGILSACCCALLGTFLVLRRMSMMGDAISHAVLPGLAVAFLLTGSRGSLAMFIGAAVVGVLTAVFTQWVHSMGKVDESASMGVVFTVLFAIGLVVIVRAADSVDLDPDCVLNGALELVGMDTRSIAGIQVPRVVIPLAGVLLLNTLFVIVFYKELKIVSFDPSLATTLGINARFMHYLLMTLVAVTTVASFEAVGSILVIAMLIVPPAAAHLLTDRLGVMLILSVLIAAISAGLGHLAAITVPSWFGQVDMSTAGTMAVVAGLIFGLTLLFAPRHGVISKLVHRGLLSLHIVAEDVLGLLYRLEESELASSMAGRSGELLRDALGVGSVMRWAVVTRLRKVGQVAIQEGDVVLTAEGREAARHLVRSHRLWESYLARHVALPVDHLHLSADQVEHYISGPMTEAMAEELGSVERDPHGSVIPGDSGSED